MSHKIKKIVLENIRRGSYERTIVAGIADELRNWQGEEDDK